LNAIVWTAKIDVPAGGVVSKPITVRDLNENLDPKKKMEHIPLPSQGDLEQLTAASIDFRWPGKPKK